MSEPQPKSVETTATVEGTIGGSPFKRKMKVPKDGEPAKTEPNKGEVRADKFAEVYGEAFKAALKAKETTDTPAWQALYADHRKLAANAKDKIKRDLERLAAQAGETGLGESGEKELKEVAKASLAVREEAEFFDRQTVATFRACAEKCEKVIADAENETVLVPMFTADIKAAIAKVKPVKWDATSGRIVI